MTSHPKGNPDLIRQHKQKQREGDEELGAASGADSETSETRNPPLSGTGKSDTEEGVGTSLGEKDDLACQLFGETALIDAKRSSYILYIKKKRSSWP